MNSRNEISRVLKLHSAASCVRVSCELGAVALMIQIAVVHDNNHPKWQALICLADCLFLASVVAVHLGKIALFTSSYQATSFEEDAFTAFPKVSEAHEVLVKIMCFAGVFFFYSFSFVVSDILFCFYFFFH